ncbi:MAG: hypothetical protein QCH35_01430 [Methanomicrobiaceae archaeon]|nr:hypothetical protein [Methanomicrobiaceae archaeon]
MNIPSLLIMGAMFASAILSGAGLMPGGVAAEGELRTEAPVIGPLQENLTSPDAFSRGIGDWHFTMTAVARYTLRGKLVARDNYSGSTPDTLSPVDLSFAWGKLIEAPYEDYVSYYKEPRHLNYHCHFPAGCPALNYSYINGHSSNNHCIFANESVQAAAEAVGIGDVVEIRGYLVDVRGVDSRGSTYTWNTSRTREDELEGACEIIWVEEVAQVSGAGIVEDMECRWGL